MARITDVMLTDVRCFEGTQRAKMGRITLLVGENGSGKSTFLGCYHVLAEMANLYDLREENHFDAKPFRMGSFISVARQGRDEFGVGARFADHAHEGLSFVFEDRDGDPVDREVRVSTPAAGDRRPRSLTLARPRDSAVVLRATGPGFTFDLAGGEISYKSISTWLSNYVREGFLPFSGNVSEFRRRTGEAKGSSRDIEFLRFAESIERFRASLPDPGTFLSVALDPRLPPRLRAYPDHGLLGRKKPELLAFLTDMGTRLSLWDGVWLNDAEGGSQTSILVGTPTGRRNLADVGYGVHSLLSHLLPFFYDQPATATFLLQQPEVHIHPRAQAGLAQWMAEDGRGFVLKTHSDHFMNRFRICVMEGIMSPEDLSILYFEPTSDGRSTIHSLSVDADGNLDGAPDGYRKFFLHETHRLLGFE